MKAMQSTWSPFQSPEVREICAHLTAEEKQHLLSEATNYGSDSALKFALPCAAVTVSFYYSRLVGFALLVPFLIYCFTIERQRVRGYQRRVREFLAATEFGRA